MKIIITKLPYKTFVLALCSLTFLCSQDLAASKHRLDEVRSDICAVKRKRNKEEEKLSSAIKKGKTKKIKALTKVLEYRSDQLEKLKEKRDRLKKR